jgi:small subunit ribosomal protein S15
MVRDPGWPRQLDSKCMSEVVNKESIITNFRTHETDTGSCEVQIALLSARVAHLTEHLRDHRKDFHSRRGLLLMTSRRRKLLNYLKKHQLDKYNEILQKLNLRK